LLLCLTQSKPIEQNTPLNSIGFGYGLHLD